MDYNTLDVKRFFTCILGFTLTLSLLSCTNGLAPPAAPTADSVSDSRPVGPSRDLTKSLPKVCDCVLRFDRLNIEQGLSQSSVYAILEDSRGFMWFGTEDG